MTNTLTEQIAMGMPPGLEAVALSVQEAATALRVQPLCIYRWLKAGRLTGYRQRYGPGLRSRTLVPMWSILNFQRQRCEETLAAKMAKSG